MASRARLLTMHRITDHIIVIKDIGYRDEVFYFGKEELALGVSGGNSQFLGHSHQVRQ